MLEVLFVRKKVIYQIRQKKEKSKSNVKNRRRSLTREGCNAKVVFKLVEGKFELIRFHESHKHSLASPMKRQFLRSARKVNHVYKRLLHAYC